METLEPYLAEHPFFKGIADRHLKVIVGCGSNARFDAGQYLDRQGEPADKFWMIRHGKVAVEMFNPVGGPLTILTLGEGEVVGWSWLFPPYIHHFDTRAMELTRVISLDGACLRRKCEEDHELGYEMFKRFAQIMLHRMSITQEQLLDVYK